MSLRDDIRLVTDELSSKSDRTVAITATALIDPLAEACLLARFRVVCTLNVHQPEFEKTLKSFIGDSLSAKITLLYLLGGIAEWAFEDLRIVVQIRNRFAHENIIGLSDNYSTGAAGASKLSFDTPRIREMCLALSAPERFLKMIGSSPLDPRRPRDRYQLSVLGLIFAL